MGKLLLVPLGIRVSTVDQDGGPAQNNFWLRGNFSTVGINHIRNASMVTEVVGVPWALRLIVSRGGPPVGPIHSKNSGLPAAQFRENT